MLLMKSITTLLVLCIFLIVSCGGGPNPDRDAKQGLDSTNITDVQDANKAPDDQDVPGTGVEPIDLSEPLGEQATFKLGSYFFTPLDLDHLRQSAGGLSGRGLIKFDEDLKEIDSNFNFNLVFELEDGGSLTFHTHADADLKDGLEITFKRLDTQLLVEVTIRENTVDWSSFFDSFDASKRIEVSLDVHNSEPVTHMLFWSTGQLETFLDSGLDVSGAPGKPYGRNWGIQLKDSKILEVTKSSPRYEH